jgi:hypothetical protein
MVVEDEVRRRTPRRQAAPWVPPWKRSLASGPTDSSECKALRKRPLSVNSKFSVNLSTFGLQPVQDRDELTA